MATKTFDLVQKDLLEQTITELKKWHKEQLLIEHPVDSLYVTTVNVNPSSFLGGNWKLFYSGEIGGTTTDIELSKEEADVTGNINIESANAAIRVKGHSSGSGNAWLRSSSNIGKDATGDVSIHNDSGTIGTGEGLEYISGLKSSFRLKADIKSLNPRVNLSNAVGSVTIYLWKRIADTVKRGGGLLKKLFNYIISLLKVREVMSYGY